MKNLIFIVILCLINCEAIFSSDYRMISQLNMIGDYKDADIQQNNDMFNNNESDSLKIEESFESLTMDDLEKLTKDKLSERVDNSSKIETELLPLSIGRIVKELKLFGIYSDSISQPELDLFVRKEIDSLTSLESVEPLHNLTELYRKYSFKDIPCIKLYLFDNPPTPIPKDMYIGVLFNTCDSTIYIFGDGATRFSKLIRKYLPEIINKNKLIDLINLYLNTLTIPNPYYILADSKDYKVIWNTAIENEVVPAISDTLKILSELDIKSIKKSIWGIDFYERNKKKTRYFNIGLSTWEYMTGTIESWNFKISDNIFEEGHRFTKYLEKGPNLILLRKF